jgi:DNA mismatch repair protein MSH6
LVDELERAEDLLKDAMVPFLCAIFSRFHEQKDTWTSLVSVLSELDCLISLAIASGCSDVTMTRPELIPEVDGTSIFDIKSMVHPCVRLSGGKNFIPNDTLIAPG